MPAPFNINANLNIQNVNTRQAQAALNQVGRAAANNTRLVEKFADTLDLKTRSFAAYALVSSAIIKLSNVIANATRDAIRFESELARIAQTSDISVKSAKSLTKELLGVSKAYGVSIGKIAETIRVLNQAGISFRDATEAAKALAKTTLLSSFEDYSVTLDGTIAAMKQFEIQGRNVEKFLSSINQVSKRYAVESTDLLEAIKRTGGVFKTTGGSVEELLALITSVRGVTRESADTISTGLRTIFSRLQRPKTIEYFKELGIELTNSKNQFIGNFQAIQEISRGLDRLGIKAGSIKFAEVVEEIGGIRQSSRVIPLLTNTVTQLEALEVAKKSNLSLDEDIAKQQKTLEFRLEQLSKEFTALIVNVSNSDSFQRITTLMIEAARAAVRLAESLAPLAPLIGLIGTFQAGVIVKRFVTGPNNPFGFNRFSVGGKVPGIGFGDQIPAALEPGEFVIRRRAAQAIGYSKLKELNAIGFNTGGVVGPESQVGSEKDNPTDVVRTKTQANAIMKDLIESLGDAGKALKEIPIIIAEVKTPYEGKVGKGSYSQKRKDITLNPNYATPSTLYHESGHALDNSLGGEGYASEKKGTFQNAIVEAQKARIEAELRAAGESEEFIKYATRNREIFARTFEKADAELQKILVSTTDLKEGNRLLAERAARKNAAKDIKQESITKDASLLSENKIDSIVMSADKTTSIKRASTGISAANTDPKLADLIDRRDRILKKRAETGKNLYPEKLEELNKKIEEAQNAYRMTITEATKEQEKVVESTKVVAQEVKIQAEEVKKETKTIAESVKEAAEARRASGEGRFPAHSSSRRYQEESFFQPEGVYGPPKPVTERGLIKYQPPATEERGLIKYQGQQSGIIPTGIKNRNNQIANYKWNTSRVVDNSERLRISGPSSSLIKSNGNALIRGNATSEVNNEAKVQQECIPVRICNPEDIKGGGNNKSPKEEAENAQTTAIQRNTLSLIEVLASISALSFVFNTFVTSFDDFLNASEEMKQSIENFTSEMIKNTTNIGIGATVGGRLGERVQGLVGSVRNRQQIQSQGGRLYNPANFNYSPNQRLAATRPSAGNQFSIQRRAQFTRAASSAAASFNNNGSGRADLVDGFAVTVGTLLTVAKTLRDTSRRTEIQNLDKTKDKAIEDGDVKGAVEAAKKGSELEERAFKDTISGTILSGIGGAIGVALTPILGPLGPELGAALGNFLAQFEVVQDILVASIDRFIVFVNLITSLFGSDPFPTLTESFEKARENAIIEAKSKALFNRSVKIFEKATDSFNSSTRLADAVGGKSGTNLRQNAVNEALKAVDELLAENNQFIGAPEEITAQRKAQNDEVLDFGLKGIVEQAKIYATEGDTVQQALSRLGASFDENNSILQNSEGVIGRYISALRSSGKTNQEVDSALATLSAGIIEVSKEVDGLAEATKELTSIQEALATASLERLRIEFERTDNSINRDLSLSEARGRSAQVGSTEGLLQSINQIGQLRANAAFESAKDPNDKKLQAQLEVYESQFRIINEQSKEYISLKEQELSIVKRSSEQFYNFLNTMTFGTNQEKRNIEASVKLAKIAASQGISAIAPNKRGEVQQALEQFADLPIFNGKTGSEVKADLNVQEARRQNGGRLTTDQERQIRNRSSSPQERIANEIADLKLALIKNEEDKLKKEADAQRIHDEAFGAAVNLFHEATNNFAQALANQQNDATKRELNTIDAQIRGLEDKKKGANREDREKAKEKLEALIERGQNDKNARKELFNRIGLSPNQQKFFESNLAPKEATKEEKMGANILDFVTKNTIGLAGPFGVALQGGISEKIEESIAPKKVSSEDYRKIIDQAVKWGDDPLRSFMTNPDKGHIDEKINSLKSRRQQLTGQGQQLDGQNVSVDASFGTVPVNVSISAPDMGVLSEMIMEKTLSAISNKFGQMAENQAFGVS